MGSLGAGAAGAAILSSLPIESFAAATMDARLAGMDEPVVILSANENAYGMFPSAAAVAAEALRYGNRYPFRAYGELEQKIAAYNNVSAKQVLIGNGSSEVLAMAARAFTGPGRKLIAAVPTFESTAAYARAHNAEVVEVPLTANFAHDLDAMLARTGNDTGLIYICNPNNPTATLTPRRDIEAFLRKLPANTYVLIDEAYHHFATDAEDYVSFIEKPVDDPRIIVARTFSKVYGMAGLRLGYSVAAEETTKKLRLYQEADNGNVIALLAGLASLNDDRAMKAAVARNAADRAAFLRECSSRRVKVIPSYANFAMIETGRPVRDVIGHFRRLNVSIGRPFPRMEQYARVSFGRPADMDAFWKAWDVMPNMAKQ
ncbi:MAG TPA: histidinol-phosphate transaminase [Terriglobales bacterium]|nr:histidinol-phosphate transaminase [Terriglobales bacterium]